MFMFFFFSYDYGCLGFFLKSALMSKQKKLGIMRRGFFCRWLRFGFGKAFLCEVFLVSHRRHTGRNSSTVVRLVQPKKI